ncbi:MAG TPA: hypothetical protein VGF76_09460, partial [Polyangiaceae bacterium]
EEDDADEFDAVSVQGAPAPGPAIQPPSASAARLALASRLTLVLLSITLENMFITSLTDWF